MADSLDKQEFKSNLITSFKFVKSNGQQIADTITSLKATVINDRSAIQDSLLLTAEEKTEWRAEYNSKLSSIKTSIETALNA